MNIKNWAGNVAFSPSAVERPNSVEAVQAIVKRAREQRQGIRVMGARHSFSQLIVTNDILISLENMTGLISVDKDTTQATVWAGTAIHQLGPLLAEHGIAFPNQGDVDAQSLAGATSTGTHGTGFEFAALANHVIAMELVDGHGNVRRVDQNSPGDVLNAARVSLGTFGILTKLTIQCVPTFVLRDQRRRVRLEDCLAGAIAEARGVRHLEFFWYPYSPWAQIKTCVPVSELAPRDTLKKYIDDEILERYLFGSLCELTAMIPVMSRLTSKIAGVLMPDASYSDIAYKVYPSSRHVRFNEMEYAVPLEQGIACFLAIKSMIERERIQVFFPIEFRVAKADLCWLSPMYGRESAIISLHVFRFTDQRRYFEMAEAIFRAHGGRPHWGKVHNMDRAQAGAYYPKWKDFEVLREEMDPDGIFLNPMLKKLFSTTPRRADSGAGA